MKKVSLLFALLCTFALGAFAQDGSWDNFRDTSWGTNYDEVESFTIENSAQLAQLAYMVNHPENNKHEFVGKTVILAADLDLSAHYWECIGQRSDGKSFSGTFLGNGHTISGMYIEDTKNFSGLFGYTENATIKQVKIANSTIQGQGDIGGIVGWGESGLIEDCHVGSDVSIKITQNNTRYVGGIAGHITGSSDNPLILRYCSSKVGMVITQDNITGTSYCGGIVGCTDSKSSVESSLFIGDRIVGEYNVGAIIGSNEGQVANCFYRTTLSTLKGIGNVETDDKALPAKTITFNNETRFSINDIVYDGIIKAYGQCLEFEGTYYSATGKEVAVTLDSPSVGWDYSFILSDNTASQKPSPGYALITIGQEDLMITYYSVWVFHGEGTEEQPYLINSVEDLNMLSKLSNGFLKMNFDGCYFKLTADLEYDGPENNFMPISYRFTNITNLSPQFERYFGGHFDGDGHTISGINVVNTGAYDNDEVTVGLFALAKNATIKNLTIANSSFTGSNVLGGIVGSMNKGQIENCHVTNTVTIQPYSSRSMGFAGGIAGEADNSSIKGCTSAASIILPNENVRAERIGGIVGSFSGTTLQDCLYYGDACRFFTSATHVQIGSIAGFASGTLTNNLYDKNKAPLGAIGGSNKDGSTDKDGANAAYIMTIKQPIYLGKTAEYIQLTDAETNTYTSFENAPAIKVYNSMLSYGDKYYVKPAKAITLTSGDKYNAAYTIETAEITNSTFNMPEADVIVSASDIYRKEWGGKGTEAEPYTIPDVAALNALAEEVKGSNLAASFAGKYFKMTADIDYSKAPTDKDNGYSNYEPIGYMTSTGEGRCFSGVFNGDGHTLKGIKLNTPTDGRATQGVFGLIGDEHNGPAVKNLKLENSTFVAVDNTIVGGIVSTMFNNGLIENCEVASTVRFGIHSSTPDKVTIGGIVGENGTILANISNCFTEAKFDLGNEARAYNIGAIAGHGSAVLSNNYYHVSNADVKGVGAENSFTGTDIDGAKPVYTLTFSDVEGGTSSTDSEATTTRNEKGYYLEGSKLHLVYTPDGDVHSGYSFSTESTSSTIEGYTLTVGSADVVVATTLDPSQYPGLGTEGDPYQIWNTTQMAKLADDINKDTGWTNYPDTFFKLMADLEYDYDTENNYTPVGLYYSHNGEWSRYFAGTFDGNGHSISGVRVSNTPNYKPTGIFGLVTGTVKNLTVKHSKFERKNNNYGSYGPIAGMVDGEKSLIENCHVTNDVEIVMDINDQNMSSGGVVGTLNHGTVKGCTSAAVWTLQKGNGTDNKESVFGYIVGSSSGATGASTTTVTDCFYYNEDKDLGSWSYCGGIVHNPDKTTITRCYHIYKGTNATGAAHIISFPDNDFIINDLSYENDHLKTYANGGLLFDGKLYINQGQNLSVTYDGDRVEGDNLSENFEIVSYETKSQLTERGAAITDQTGKNATITMGEKDAAVVLSLVLDATAAEENVNYQKMELQDGNQNNVTIKNLKLYADKCWNTLCLPFDVTINNDTESDDYIVGNTFVNATAKTMKSSSFADGTLSMQFSEDLTTIPAGTPFLIKFNRSGNNLVSPVFRDVIVDRTKPKETETDKVSLVGSWEQTTLLGHNNFVLYMGSNNTLYYPTDDVTINGFHAYFQLNGLEVDELKEGSVKSFILDFGDGESTGIRTIGNGQGTIDPSVNGEWYDLSGRRIAVPSTSTIPSVLPKGVYINNGRKIIIK